MSLITPSDFVGIWTIKQAYNDDGTKLQEYIDHCQEHYLVKLFGSDMYTLFLADYDTPSSVYEKLYLPLRFDSDWYSEHSEHGKPAYISKGVQDMLKSLIYAHWRKQDLGVPTANGQLNSKPEGGTKALDSYADYFSIYNRGVKSAKAIRQYICENSNDYPDFNGQKIITSWLV